MKFARIAFALTVCSYFPINASSAPFDGYYGSVALGVNSLGFDPQHSSSFTSGTFTANSIVNEKALELSPYGELSLGRGWTFSNVFYFGIEGFADLSYHKIKNSLNMINHFGTSGVQDRKSTIIELNAFSAGVAFQPGVMLAPQTLFYGTVGWEAAREKLESTQYVRVTTASEGTQFADDSHFLNGLRLGVGFFQFIDPSMTLGIRYLYTHFGGDDSSNPPTALSTGANLTGPFSYTVETPKRNTQTISASLSYYWDQCYDLNEVTWTGYRHLYGFYVTSQLGALNRQLSPTDIDMSTTYFDRASVVNHPELTSTVSNGPDNIMVNLGVGISKFFAYSIYTAIEGSIDWSKYNFDNYISHDVRPVVTLAAGQPADTLAQEVKIDLWNFQPNLDLKLGALFNKHLLGYIRAGLSFNKMELTLNDQLAYIGRGGSNQFFSIETTEQNGVRAHGRLGLGAEYQFSTCNAFSINYIYTYYGRLRGVNMIDSTDGAGRPIVLLDDLEVKLKNNALTIGLTHYF